eukprot:6177060-Pleurochrysis_carterae.AAC.4
MRSTVNLWKKTLTLIHVLVSEAKSYIRADVRVRGESAATRNRAKLHATTESRAEKQQLAADAS